MERLDRDGVLLAPVEEVVQQIVAANVGVTLQLIGEPAGTDPALSARLRENVLSGLIAPRALGASTAEVTDLGEVAQTAARLAALLAAGPAAAPGLSAAERGLLGEWLTRLVDADVAG